MTALERAARALAIEAGHNHSTIHHIRQARAVLMAVREPGNPVWESLGVYAHDALDTYPMVIDAILNEKGTTND